MVPTGHVRAGLQRKQSELYDTAFAVELSKRIINAKIKNQEVVLSRYAKSKETDIGECEKMMRICRNKIADTRKIDELMGFEGCAAKCYFEGLSQCIDDEFIFQGRSKRPPLDEFNSIISFGYSILMNEIYGEIEMKGLNPYFGFMHRDSEKHPTLASNLMEEWRAVIVDATVMSMINGHEDSKTEFSRDVDGPGCYLSHECMKKYLSKLEKKLRTDIKYLDYINYRVPFRRVIGLQVNQLAKAIEAEDPTLYHPIIIR